MSTVIIDVPFDIKSVLDGLVDGPFDYARMGHALNDYGDSLAISEQWTRIHNGTHLYYRYMARLIELANKPGSILRASFGYRRGIVQSFASCDVVVPASFVSLTVAARPVSTLRADSMPNKMWDAIFSYLPHDVQLGSRTVCSRWCDILTLRTHVFLVLSLPDRWTDIISPDPDKNLVTFIREFALEAEIDMAAMIVLRGIIHVVRGFRLRNWPVFPYNFFLHLCTNVESVIIEARGVCMGCARPPAVPCPFLLPASVTELRLIRVSLSNYSVEGMLDPNGRLERLHIESVDEGALVCWLLSSLYALREIVTLLASQYLPDTISLPPEQRDYVRASLAFNTFRSAFISSPLPAKLRYVRLDLLSDPYGLQVQNSVLNMHLEGGFALIHQLFQTVLGRGQFDMFVNVGETYPLQTCVCNLEELDLRVGTQYYGDVSYLWPGMSSSLTILTIRLPEHHSGGFISNIDLGGLNVLSLLTVITSYRGVYCAMRTVSTWASACKGCSSSTLRLELEIVSLMRICLGNIINASYMKKCLEGTAKNNWAGFKGKMVLVLRSPDWFVHDADHGDAVTVVQALADDVGLGLQGAECLRFHGDEQIL
ncbi:uncharacterized protein ARMOST_09167 [Armillaria ostoyae]|uniref:F-box domain-containing protein n=1 Tax=Armillaria ostoyae TaxID=47428 RepID=A0A284RAS3_ARMOS|nr:uncharacterized protein ARMOST_09167 [Armillaria ostoyae]